MISLNCVNFIKLMHSVAKELNDFKDLYKQLQSNVAIDDLTSNNVKMQELKVSDGDAEPEHEDDGNEFTENSTEHVDNSNVNLSWTNQGFIKPLRLLQRLSGFTILQYMYKILVTLPVTSCTAERAMSRVRIVKNRLRTIMLDDWFAALICLASEKRCIEQSACD